MATVTTYIESLRENDSLSLPTLTHKTVMLLALTRPSRSADLSQLDLRFRHYLPEGVTFQPTKLAKQSRQLKPIAEFFFPVFTQNKLLCPVSTLLVYEEKTTTQEGDGLKAPLPYYHQTSFPSFKLHNRSMAKDLSGEGRYRHCHIQVPRLFNYTSGCQSFGSAKNKVCQR